jgi:hypothetical protein
MAAFVFKIKNDKLLKLEEGKTEKTQNQDANKSLQ